MDRVVGTAEVELDPKSGADTALVVAPKEDGVVVNPAPNEEAEMAGVTEPNVEVVDPKEMLGLVVEVAPKTDGVDAEVVALKGEELDVVEAAPNDGVDVVVMGPPKVKVGALDFLGT